MGGETGLGCTCFPDIGQKRISEANTLYNSSELHAYYDVRCELPCLFKLIDQLIRWSFIYLLPCDSYFL